MTSHTKTLLTVSVRTAERTASDLACEQAPSEGGKKIRRGRKKTSGERSEPLSAKKKNFVNCAPPRHHSPLGSPRSP